MRSINGREGKGEVLVHVHLVLRVGTTEVVFGGFVEAVFVVLEQIRELQKLVFSIFDVSRLSRLEGGLKRSVDLPQDDRCRKAQSGQ